MEVYDAAGRTRPAVHKIASPASSAGPVQLGPKVARPAGFPQMSGDEGAQGHWCGHQTEGPRKLEPANK